MKASSPVAVQLDPQKRAAEPALRATVLRLADYLESTEARLGLRKRQRKHDDRAKFRLAVEAIACNLVALSLSGSAMPLAVPRDGNLMWSAKRYRSPVYGSHFLDALDLFAHPEVGFVEVVTTGFRLADGSRRQTSIRATAAFHNALGDTAWQWSALTRTADPEVLVLNGVKDGKSGRAERIDYTETASTRRLRKEVQTINAHLRAAPLALLPASRPVDPNALPVDPTRRTLRRIFNNGSWKEGGRLFDGFWMSMPKLERHARLRIGTPQTPTGEPIVSLDYGQLFASLAYRQCALPVPDGDLYDIRMDGSHRDGFKALLNALLFARGTMTRWPEDTSSAFPTGTKLRSVVADIVSHHAPIAHLFGTGIGFRLMNIEAGILISVLLRLFAQGITALPLHDSVIVAQSHEEAARDAMQAAFGEYTGQARAKLSVEKSL